MSSPPSVMRPRSGCSNPAIIRSVVVLPEPEGPSSVKNSPAPTFRSTSSTATTSPYSLRHPSTETSAANHALQDVEPALELGVLDRERHEDADHVAVDPAREEHQALFARSVRDARRLVAGLLCELDRHHRAEPAHLGARGRHRVEPRADARADVLCAWALLVERVEDRDRG